MLKDCPDVMTADQVKEILGIGRDTVYNLIRCGRIQSVRIGRQIRVTKAALLRFLNETEENPLDDHPR